MASLPTEPLRGVISKFLPFGHAMELGDNCIQICLLGRYIVRYTVGNFVLRRTYIRRYTSPNYKLEYGYPHSNVLFNIYTSKPGICIKYISCISDLNSQRRPIINNVAHDVGFPAALWRNILSQISDVIQSDIVLYLQVH